MDTRLLFILCLLCSPLFAGIEEAFKPALNKSERHRMKEIDFIYMINLDQRPEKFEMSEKQLNPFHIYPYRFSAVNGWEIPLETLERLGVVFEPWMLPLKGTRYPFEYQGKPFHEETMKEGVNYFAFHMSRGAIGIVLSHCSVLQDAYNSGYETIWVMEDDIDVIQDPNLLSDRILELDALVGKGSWDILFTDPDTKDRKGNYVICLSYAPKPNFSPSHPERFASRVCIHPRFEKKGARYGAYSMILRRSGIKKILDCLKTYKIFLPYDMEYTLPNDIQIYTLTEDIVSTLPKALTDNGLPNYKSKEF